MSVDEKRSSVLDGLIERAELARDLDVCERTVKRYEDQLGVIAGCRG